MSFLIIFFLLGLVVGLAAVASNPSPFFAALGLVVVAGLGCGALAVFEGTFLCLILFLIYLGGMLVVFAYSAALAADPYPETWASWPVFGVMMFYLAGIVLGWATLSSGLGDNNVCMTGAYPGSGVGRGDVEGVALVYSSGGYMLVGAAWTLLLTLFVVLEVTRGIKRGALRSV